MDKVSILKNIGVVLLLIASSIYYYLQTKDTQSNIKKSSTKEITEKAKVADETLKSIK